MISIGLQEQERPSLSLQARQDYIRDVERPKPPPGRLELERQRQRQVLAQQGSIVDGLRELYMGPHAQDDVLRSADQQFSLASQGIRNQALATDRDNRFALAATGNYGGSTEDEARAMLLQQIEGQAAQAEAMRQSNIATGMEQGRQRFMQEAYGEFQEQPYEAQGRQQLMAALGHQTDQGIAGVQGAMQAGQIGQTTYNNMSRLMGSAITQVGQMWGAQQNQQQLGEIRDLLSIQRPVTQRDRSMMF